MEVEAVGPVEPLEQDPRAVRATVPVAVREDVEDPILARLADEEGPAGAEAHEARGQDVLGEELEGVARSHPVPALEEVLGRGIDPPARHEGDDRPPDDRQREAGPDAEQAENSDSDQQLAHDSLQPPLHGGARVPYGLCAARPIQATRVPPADRDSVVFTPWGLDESPIFPDT